MSGASCVSCKPMPWTIRVHCAEHVRCVLTVTYNHVCNVRSSCSTLRTGVLCYCDVCGAAGWGFSPGSLATLPTIMFRRLRHGANRLFCRVATLAARRRQTRGASNQQSAEDTSSEPDRTAGDRVRTGCTMGAQWVHDGCAVGARWVFSGCKRPLHFAYSGWIYLWWKHMKGNNRWWLFNYLQVAGFIFVSGCFKRTTPIRFVWCACMDNCKKT